MQTKQPLLTARKRLVKFTLYLATIFAILFGGATPPKSRAAIVELVSFQSGYQFYDNAWLGQYDQVTFTFEFRLRSAFDPATFTADTFLDRSLSTAPNLTLETPGMGIRWGFTPETLTDGPLTITTSFTRISGGAGGDTSGVYFVPDGVIQLFQAKWTIKSAQPALVGIDFDALNLGFTPGDSTPDNFWDIPDGTVGRTTPLINLNNHMPEPGPLVNILGGLTMLCGIRFRRKTQ